MCFCGVVRGIVNAFRDADAFACHTGLVHIAEEGIINVVMTCHSGGSLDIFIDAVVPRRALLIIGALPSAKALAAAKSSNTASAAGSAATGSAIDPVRGMNVELATAEFTSEYLGQTCYFCCPGCQHSFEKLPQHYLQSGEGSA